MRRIGTALAAIIFASTMSATSAFAQSEEGGEASEEVLETAAVDENAGTVLTEDELEVLVARIALYPDELVALIIAASLYPLEIVEAERFLEKYEADPSLEPDSDWDGSVISLLNYPDIIKMMSDDLDWTQLVGEVAVNQQKDMLVAIQQLRDEAVASGVLQTNEQTTIVEDNDNIVIESADPEVVYVPQYPPEMLYDPTYVVPPQPIVYSDPYPNYYSPGATFWTGLAAGAVFAAVVDWDDWGTYGGDIDVDIKVDGDKIEIKGGDRLNVKGGDKIKIEGGDKDFDLNKVDRNNIDIDRNSFNKTEFKKDLEKNDFNNVAVRGNNKKVDRSKNNQVVKGKDVRANIERDLKDPNLAKRPDGGNRPEARPGGGNRPEARPAGGDRPKAKPAVAKKPAARPAKVTKKKAASPKPGSRPDKRAAKPSVMGDKAKGKPAKIHSDRGRKSRGGGMKGGGGKRGGRGR